MANSRTNRKAEIEKELSALYEQQNALNAQVNALKAEANSIEYGFSSGDKVKDKHGRLGIVADMSNYFPTIRLIRKDGTPGERTITIYRGDEWAKA